MFELLKIEIKVLQTCDNINIVKLLDIKKTKNNYYLMLEYCNQGDLYHYLRKKGKLSQRESLEIFYQILNGFKSLYKNDIIHRDFKLANVLRHNGHVKIADFGFSKIMTKSKQYTRSQLGTPYYMAPELWKGEVYDYKIDIWALGICLYELLTGSPPFKAETQYKMLECIQNTPLYFKKELKIHPVV